jgi:DNA-binding LytR/AlgR family response regulator
MPAQKDHQIEKLSFRTVNGKIFVNQNDIAYFLADGNYSQIIMFQDSDVLMESLRMLEQRLDPNVFLRIDRKTIINLKRIYKINSRRRQCTFKAKDGTELILDISKNGTETLLNHI